MLRSDDILADGNKVTLLELDSLIADNARKKGIVGYYREAGTDFSAIQATQAFQLIVKHQRPYSISSKADFSDYVGQDENACVAALATSQRTPSGEEKLLRTKTAQGKWFLRIPGNTVFGPVATEELLHWAEQGRVVPGNEVSMDQRVWLPAESVPELQMHWFVEDSDRKRVGPFNRVAAEMLIKSGRAPSGAHLVKAEAATGKSDAIKTE